MACQVVTIKDKKYPKLLKRIGKSAPKQLYYKGNWSEEIFENCLAVVGSRRMTTYGKQVVERIVGEVAAAGVTIVSGFMYGIDAQAHRVALKVGGRTIAVMPCGIERIHPEYQQDLYVEILNNNGLVISEYEGDMQPALWTYPCRNRIVAGLSRVTLIIEAGEKSGALITADYAKKFGRKVYVVPNPITSENSKGIMKLIKGGAEVVSSAEDILRFYGSHSVLSSRFTLKGSDASQKVQNARSNSPSENPELSPSAAQKVQNARSSLESKILDHLQREAMGVDDLVRTLGRPAGELGVTLSIMELKGLIKQEGNKYYIQ